MNQPTLIGEIITISPTVHVYPWVYQGKVISYMIQRSTELVEQEVALTPAEFNAIASHAPIVQAMRDVLQNAMDWIEDECPDRSDAEFYSKRSQVIEGAHAALQGMEDSEI